MLQYVHNFSVKFRGLVQLISVDDKATAPVGEPISTGVRGHNRALVCGNSQLVALDHDFHVHGIVSSVTLSAHLRAAWVILPLLVTIVPPLKNDIFLLVHNEGNTVEKSSKY